MGGKWPYNCCFGRCCFLEYFPSSFFSKHSSLESKWCNHIVVQILICAYIICLYCLKKMDEKSLPTQDHMGQWALLWSSWLKGTKEALQRQHERIPWCLSHWPSPMVYSRWEPWYLDSHLWKPPGGHPQGQKAQDKESQHSAIKPWPDLHLWPLRPYLQSVWTILFLIFIYKTKLWWWWWWWCQSLIACTILSGQCSLPSHACFCTSTGPFCCIHLLYNLLLFLFPQKLYLLICWVLSFLAFIQLVLIVLFWVVINHNSIFLFRISLHSHVQVI